MLNCQRLRTILILMVPATKVMKPIALIQVIAALTFQVTQDHRVVVRVLIREMTIGLVVSRPLLHTLKAPGSSALRFLNIYLNDYITFINIKISFNYIYKNVYTRI